MLLARPSIRSPIINGAVRVVQPTNLAHRSCQPTAFFGQRRYKDVVYQRRLFFNWRFRPEVDQTNDPKMQNPGRQNRGGVPDPRLSLKFRGFGPQDVEELVDGGPAFEIATFNKFIKAARSGNFPGPRRTTLDIWPESEMEYFGKKFADWAPKPYCDVPQPAGPFGPMEGQSPPAIIRVMHVFSALDDVFNRLFSSAALNLSDEEVARSFSSENKGRSFHIMKSKIWFGISPISDAHWKAKGLDEIEHIEEALSILQSVVDVFDHLYKPEIQGQMRDIFNKVFLELDVFQDASNALHSSRGEHMPRWSISKLWQDYTHWHFKFMEEQARAWMFRRLNTLHSIWFRRFLSSFQNVRSVTDTHGILRLDHWVIMVLGKILDLYRDVEFIVRARTDGFHMIYGTHEAFATVALDGPSEGRNRIYSQLETARISAARSIMEEQVNLYSEGRRQHTPTPDFLETAGLVADRTHAYKSCQPFFENPPETKIEPWVQELSEDKVEMFGFVIYRLSYAETDEEWEKFCRKMEAGLDSVWDGIVGSDKIKQKAILQWIDGRDADIKEGDMAAARKHFKDTFAAPESSNSLSSKVCLAVTPLSVSSFSGDQLAKSTGDFRGFIHVIDVKFDPAESSSSLPATGQTSGSSTRPARPHPKRRRYLPGYDGTFKILDQLVWTDLYALHIQMACVNTLEDMWVISTQHPWGVYTGPTTGITRRNWREMRGMGGHMLKLAKEKADQARQGS